MSRSDARRYARPAVRRPIGRVGLQVSDSAYGRAEVPNEATPARQIRLPEPIAQRNFVREILQRLGTADVVKRRLERSNAFASIAAASPIATWSLNWPLPFVDVGADRRVERQLHLVDRHCRARAPPSDRRTPASCRPSPEHTGDEVDVDRKVERPREVVGAGDLRDRCARPLISSRSSKFSTPRFRRVRPSPSRELRPVSVPGLHERISCAGQGETAVRRSTSD